MQEVFNEIKENTILKSTKDAIKFTNSFQKKDGRFLLIKLDKPVTCFSRYEQWKELYRMISTTKRIYKRIRKHM